MDRGGSKMLLQSISLKNFRQFVNEEVEFSVDPERNVTLIIGEIGTGKTTLAQAFFWCLYGETSFADKTIINRAVAEELLPDQIATVKVTLKLIHGSAHYEIIRTQDYKKTYGNKIIGANTVLNIAIKTEDGNTRYLKALECETEIKKILPKELSNYFFFDGERIEKMSKEIAAGRKSNSFANAVVGLTGLNATLSALNHLSPTKLSTSVIGKFNAEYVGDSDGQIKKLNAEIETLQNEIDSIDIRLSEIEDEIAAADQSKRKFEDDIKQFADGEKLQKEKEKLLSEIKAARKTRAMLIKGLTNIFNNDATRFFSLSMVNSALSVINRSDVGGKDIPEMHSKTIDYLLKRGTCICGTQLMEGSIPYNNLKKLFEYLPPQAIGTTVGAFVKEARAQYAKECNLFDSVSEQMASISMQDENISNLSDDLGSIEEKLDGDDVREQVKMINAQIIQCESIIKDRKAEQTRKLIRRGAADTEKTQKSTKVSELSLMDKNNQFVERCKEYAIRIYEELSDEYALKEKEIRSKLENYINEIFKTIYNGGLSLSIDEKYNVSVYVNDFDGRVETSTAQSISVIFAFISAIIKLARENRVENGDEAYSEPYPLVMDAPLSAFDKRRIKAICKAIPETAEQVIIFIKDTDGELAEQHLGTKVMNRYRFNKIDEFNTELV